jgi:hypothetical protein
MHGHGTLKILMALTKQDMRGRGTHYYIPVYVMYLQEQGPVHPWFLTFLLAIYDLFVTTATWQHPIIDYYILILSIITKTEISKQAADLLLL